MQLFNFKRYKFYKIYRNTSSDIYELLTFYKRINYKKFKYIPIYFATLVVISTIVYLNIPIFFSYDKSEMETKICGNFGLKCSIQGKIKYKFYPTPRIQLDNIAIKDFTDNNKDFAQFTNLAIKVSIYNLLNKEKFDFTKLELKKGEINFDLRKLNEYKKLFQKGISLKSINITKTEIKFFDGKKHIVNLTNSDLEYKFSEKIDKAVLKGNFLGDNISINFVEKKNKKKPSKIFLIKFFNLGIFTKINILDANSDKNITNATILFKKNKSKLTAIFDYNSDQIFIKHANLRNQFLDGKFNGEIKLSPYFNFDLYIDLNSVNFNQLNNLLVKLYKENEKNLFKLNNKINGQLNLSTNKIYSKYDLINSFESQVKFINGNILIERLLLNMGKLGAADITGQINNEKKFSNFKFENNIFIDNTKYFHNKFGIYEKPSIHPNLFVSGNFDLQKLIMRFDEISTNKKFTNEDIGYIEKEFNDLLLQDGFKSFFNFPNFKQFVKLIFSETN